MTCSKTGFTGAKISAMTKGGAAPNMASVRQTRRRPPRRRLARREGAQDLEPQPARQHGPRRSMGGSSGYQRHAVLRDAAVVLDAAQQSDVNP